jgi:hypothetical protein
MLDYAANAVRYWPVETIRERFEATSQEHGQEPDIVVGEFISCNADDGAIGRFWETVETNLRAGRIRLIFAADGIPPELRRVIAFLNEQMNPAEVLGIEIRQYVGTGVRTLVPSVIRSTKRASMTDTGLPNPLIDCDALQCVSLLQDTKATRFSAPRCFPNMPITIGTVVRIPTANSASPAAFRSSLLSRLDRRRPIPTPKATRVPAIKPISGTER